MNNIKILFITLFFYSCGMSTPLQRLENKKEIQIENKIGFTSVAGSHLELINIKGHEYLLWHNGYGSDMEHFDGCKNESHCN